jgi:2-polyprenyl-3-methyl-5-hydroxy-6-metoxy-1,4-benzoquinol methylase
MFEQQPQSLREKVKTLSQAALDSNQPTRWFEELYAQAEGQTDQVPWARLTVHPHIQHWLDHGQIKGNGQRVMVIGCGLGDDAEALQALGFQVTAFDISETAIAWCRQRFPQSSVDYQVADLFALDPAWQQGFDLVVECRNVQALPLSVRSLALSAVAQLVAPDGTLLMVTRLRSNDNVSTG